MKIIILLFIGLILYLISRGYKTEKYMNIKTNYKQKFNGNIENHEAGLLIALMAKVAKADGRVCELESELLKNIFTDISSHFENQKEIREQLKNIYYNEKKTFNNTIDIASKYLSLTKRDYNKRIYVLKYLLHLAYIDDDFSNTEQMIIEDIANAMQINKNDLDNTINEIKNLLKNKNEDKKTTLKNAYKILQVSEGDNILTVKKQYRKLVKLNHPDIIVGQGGDNTTIEKANEKLQEINSAYETIKTHLNT